MAHGGSDSSGLVDWGATFWTRSGFFKRILDPRDMVIGQVCAGANVRSHCSALKSVEGGQVQLWSGPLIRACSSTFMFETHAAALQPQDSNTWRCFLLERHLTGAAIIMCGLWACIVCMNSSSLCLNGLPPKALLLESIHSNQEAT